MNASRSCFLRLVAGIVLAFAAMPGGQAAITLTKVHQFDSAAFAADPGGGGRALGLILGTDGNFYGMSGGGANGGSIIFQLTPDGVLTSLHENSPAKAGPVGKLLQAVDGNFYGVDGNAIFKLTPDGVYTVLHAFTTDPDMGISPNGSLVQGPDGDLYGTTMAGDTIFVGEVESPGYGTVFKISPADGTLTTLYRFNGDEASTPITGLLLASDGNFYGVAGNNRFTNGVVVYRITPDGVLSALHRFDGAANQVNMASGLIQGRDGVFYIVFPGAVYGIAQDGTASILHTFDYADGDADGRSPDAPLVQGSDGNLYGTTEYGGLYSYGTIFRVTPDGVFTTLRSFDGVDGSDLVTSLVQGVDGSFYGATGAGPMGALNSEIFRLTMDDAPSLPDVTITTVKHAQGIVQDDSDPGILLTLSSPPDRNLKVHCRLKGQGLSGEAITVEVKLKIKAGQTSRFFSTRVFLPDSLDYNVPAFDTETIKVRLLPHEGYVLNGKRKTNVHRYSY